MSSSSSAAAFLVAPSSASAWKACCILPSNPHHNAVLCKPIAHRRSRSAVCSSAAGDRRKYPEQKVKEKGGAGSSDVEETTAGSNEAKAGENAMKPDVKARDNIGDQDKGAGKQQQQQQQVGYSVAKQRIDEEIAKQKSLEREAASAKRDIEIALAKHKELEEKHKALESRRKALAKRREQELAEAKRKTAAAEELRLKQEEKKKLELEAARELERVERKHLELVKLADESAALGSKFFYYPLKAVAGSEVEIFLNRDITALAAEENLQIMGAFNNWEWQSFTNKLQRSRFEGWWSCKVGIPKEAYVMNFVFFNGENVYENNDMKDFFIPVVGGMEVEQFEDFLVDQKRKEAERAAAEQAEKERAIKEARKLADYKAAEEADKAEAKKTVAEQRERARRVLQKAVTKAEGIWEIQPSVFSAGQTVKLFYNISSGPLALSPEVWILGGYNNWQEGVSISRRLSPSATRRSGWWAVDIFVPKEAFLLDWVFADGPPNSATVYDNNNYQDFHAVVPECLPEEVYWRQVEERVYARIRKERKEREDAARQKEALKSRMKEDLKLKTKALFQQSQASILYTQPVEVKAGKQVSVFYNPSNTVLNGKPEVWLRYSFNRWTHKRGPWPPIKMVPAASNTRHVKASVLVPLDAYVMDAVFSERGDEHGGVFDNKDGLDYHIPVTGSIVKEPPTNIVHISCEMAPIAKVGGLGDVVTSLSRAVQELGHNVEVVLPKYDCLKYNQIHELEEKEAFHLGGTQVRVWSGKVEGISVSFLEPENGFFWVGCVYGRRDDGHRFHFFCNAALEFLLRTGRHVDIIHCHDWSTAPVAWLFQEGYKHYGLSSARVVFTIHNLEFGASQIGKAMANANMATTVSSTYAKEVSGNPVISPHLSKFHGIRNGIDLDIWDPFDDPHIPIPFTSRTVVDGKRAAKRELQHRLDLKQEDRPLVGIITRLTAQKGIHLIKHAIWRTLERSGQVVLLGSAPDPRVQNDFVNLSNQLRGSHSDMARLCLTYDEPLSHLIYAASDFILVPSIFEPCGLTQLIAMRYGAIPVVRRTGGLNDTVFDVDHDKDRAVARGLEANGFSFDGTDAAGVDYALNRALSAWYEGRDWFHSLCAKVMEQDWSWNRPALDYVELYYGAKK